MTNFAHRQYKCSHNVEHIVITDGMQLRTMRNSLSLTNVWPTHESLPMSRSDAILAHLAHTQLHSHSAHADPKCAFPVDVHTPDVTTSLNLSDTHKNFVHYGHMLGHK